MRCDHPAVYTPTQQESKSLIDKRTAYHQAGRAMAICLGNRSKQLPDVHFQIVIKPQAHNGQPLSRASKNQGRYAVTLEGGRLVQSLPYSFAEVAQTLCSLDQEHWLCAFEADVTNLLVGSLAEAKYVALRDGKPFNATLVYLGALQFYGGKAAMDTIDEYMGCLVPDQTGRKQKLAELFLSAYSFINQPANWGAITALAEYILGVQIVEVQSPIDCEDVAAFLEDRLAARIGLTG
ncbi:MAG: hypothetical protein HOP36_08850 [Methyloglobulus sp.]|nr:hypothetical protein [Methyloglobulus sp.]